jgi:hypothetical protein
MKTILEKKWFVFVKDKHEGPFSIDEILDRIQGGTLSKDLYVWREGMSDWKLAPVVPEFESVFQALDRTSSEGPGPTISVSHQNPGSQGGFIESSSTPAPDSVSPSEDKPKPEESPIEDKAKESRSYIKFKLLIFVLAAVTILSVTFQNLASRPLSDESPKSKESFTMRLAQRFPLLSRWMSPLPPLDTSEDEYDELRFAVKNNFETVGAKFATALSKREPIFPELYIASNLPDGAKLKIRVSGVPSTLLNWLSFEKEFEVVLQKHFAQTGKIQFQDGKPIPRGDYVVIIMPSENQAEPLKGLFANQTFVTINLLPDSHKDPKVLAFKTYFLGGPKDATYVTRLKEYHDRLRDKASREIEELKQFTVTLETQLEATVNQFNDLKEGRTKTKNKNKWSDFHQTWSKLEDNLSSIFNGWTPSVIKDEYFYGSLYQLTHQLGQAIDRVHLFQNTFFTSTQDLKTLQIQIGESTAAAQSALTLAKSRLEQKEKAPISANGLPPLDGP